MILKTTLASLATQPRKCQPALIGCVAFCFFTSACSSLLRAQPYDEAPSTLKVMTWNVEWMFDDYTGDNRSDLAREQSAPSKNYWQAKVDMVAKGIAESRPHIVALQEIEGGQTLNDIRKRLKDEHQLSYRYAFIQGTDTFTEQDVGILMRNGLVEYRRHEQSKTMFDSREYYNISKHLVGEFRWSNVDRPLTLMTVHFRATAEAEEPRRKQARLARRFLEADLAAGNDVIILGDFNSEYPAGTVRGDIAELVGDEGKTPLVDLLKMAPPNRRRTHLVLDKQFDRVMASPSMLEDGPGTDWVFEDIEVLPRLTIRGQPDGEPHWDNRLTMPINELDVSDHFPVVATFQLK